MTETFIGIVIGILTSLLAGLFLIWKGEQIIRHLRKLPTKRRVALFSRAYILALRSYPYRYVQIHVFAIFAAFQLVAIIGYGLLTYILFRVPFGDPNIQISVAIRDAFKAVNSAIAQPFLPWILLIITIFLIYMTIRFTLRALPEVLVPYAHREMTRLRECVEKCATKKQFLEYTDMEHRVQTTEDLRRLIFLAKTIIGDLSLELANEILMGVSENVPVIQKSADKVRNNRKSF